MQIAGHIAHVMSKKSWKLDTYKVKFKTGSDLPAQNAIEQKVQQNKSRWETRLNAGPNTRVMYGRRS